MLRLTNIKKDYAVGAQTVHALKGITAAFETKQFVAVLGPSGCGKTTLMNIIGGLDRATDGDLIINGKSTKEYKDADWNNYRNHKIGFVFQAYNLIPHLSVAGNVELALTLSGVDAKEKKKRALEALEKVGLSDQAHKRPNQLSGGQMQRVAIARAIVNNPQILLADEPTGAIDSDTGKQIMAILQEIAKECLVIMVTHNQELAADYVDRIIQMKDGLAISDEQNTAKKPIAEGATGIISGVAPIAKTKASMNFATAIMLSFTNLLNKKGRSLLTVIAGSISIICIVLILAMNSGFANYINTYERESLAKYPIEVTSQTSSILDMFQDSLQKDEIDVSSIDLNSMIDLFKSDEQIREKYTDDEIIYLARRIMDIMSTFKNSGIGGGGNPEEMFEKLGLKLESDISVFMKDLEKNFNPQWGAIRSDYNLQLNLYTGKESAYKKINPVYDRLFSSIGSLAPGGIDETTRNQMRTMLDSLNPWSMMTDDKDILHSEYKLLAGDFPDYTTEEGMRGVVIVVDEYNQIDDFTLFCLGKVEIMTLIFSGLLGVGKVQEEYDFEEFLDTEFTVMLPSDYYTYDDETGLYTFSDSNEVVEERGITLKVSGIARLKEGVSGGSISGTVGYTQALAEYIINATNESDISRAQKAEYEDFLERYARLGEVQAILVEAELDLSTVGNAELMALVAQGKLTMADLALLGQAASGGLGIKSVTTGESLDEAAYGQFMSVNLDTKDLNKPSKIFIYPSSVANKNKITAYLDDFNARINADAELMDDSVDYTITYVDQLSEMTASMKSMIDTITYILIGVAAIAVVVSMLLVAIILYISVQDRTKEIGLLRSLGASRGNVASVFIAETFIIGLIAGIIGVLLGLVLIFPANAIILSVLGIPNLLQAVWWQQVLLVALSLIITVVSGLIPALLAAKKDPVLALRTE